MSKSRLIQYIETEMGRQVKNIFTLELIVFALCLLTCIATSQNKSELSYETQTFSIQCYQIETNEPCENIEIIRLISPSNDSTVEVENIGNEWQFSVTVELINGDRRALNDEYVELIWESLSTEILDGKANYDWVENIDGELRLLFYKFPSLIGEVYDRRGETEALLIERIQ